MNELSTQHKRAYVRGNTNIKRVPTPTAGSLRANLSSVVQPIEIKTKSCDNRGEPEEARGALSGNWSP